MGDRQISVLGAAVLSAGLTVVGVLLFSFVLKLQFPLFVWPGQ